VTGEDVDFDINVAQLAEAASAFALRLFDSRQYEQALHLLLGSFQIEPTANKMYNIACCHALMGKTNEALEALKQSIALGWSNFEHLGKDTDLASLRETEEFQRILRQESKASSQNAQEVTSSSNAGVQEIPEAASSTVQENPEASSTSKGINSLLHSLSSILKQASGPLVDEVHNATVNFGHTISQTLNHRRAPEVLAETLPSPPVDVPASIENPVLQVPVPMEVPQPVESPPTALPIENYVPQVVLPAPIIPEESPKYFEEMLILRGMGFNDQQANFAALETTQGNVSRAIDRLLA